MITATFGAAGEPVTWLRLHHRLVPVTGEHELRAGSSDDGVHWTWAGVHTLPVGADLQLGLAARGSVDPAPVRFDYLRVYRP